MFSWLVKYLGNRNLMKLKSVCNMFICKFGNAGHDITSTKKDYGSFYKMLPGQRWLSLLTEIFTCHQHPVLINTKFQSPLLLTCLC